MPRHGPTLDDLLRDSLVETVMRADRVDPQALRSLLADVAVRLGGERKSPLAPKSPIDRRPPSRMPNPHLRTRSGEPCGALLAGCAG